VDLSTGQLILECCTILQRVLAVSFRRS